MQRRVVVTGIGAVTPLGLSREESWEGIVAGKSAGATITQFDASEYPVRIACELPSFDAEAFVDKREARKMDPCTQYAVASSLMAWKDSGLEDGGFDRDRVGVLIGSGVGGFSEYATTNSGEYGYS